MKRLTAFFILGCLFTTGAFAQINVGAYAKSYWIPYRLTVFEDGETANTTAVQVPWGEPDISAGINIDGWSEWGGLHLGVDVANGASNRSSYVFSAKGGGWVWVKPFGLLTDAAGLDTFTIWLGNPNDSTLQGKIGGSNFATYVLNKSYSIDRILAQNGYISQNRERDFRLEIQDPQYNTFTRFNPYPWGNGNAITQNLWWPSVAAAAMITWEPVDRLFFGFFVAPEMRRLRQWTNDPAGISIAQTESHNGNPLSDDDINQDFYDAAKVYRYMQIGLGYTFQGIGLARLQFVGVRNVIEAAFQLTALGDLIFDIGFKIPFEGTDREDDYTYKKRRDFQASIAATYRDYDFRITGRVDTAFAGSDSSQVGRPIRQRGLNMVVYLVPQYQFGAGILGLDLGLEYEQKDDFNLWEDDSLQAGAGLWFQRSMANATFKMGMVTRLPLDWSGNQQPFDLMFPLMLEVGF